jgi:hypothetical protein
MTEEKIQESEVKETKKPVFHWQFAETGNKEKNKKHYLIAMLVLAAFLIFAIFDKNFLFIVFLILTMLIITLEHKRKPLIVDFYIFEDGIKISDKFYTWQDIKNFRIVYEPPQVKNIYFDFKGMLIPSISLPLEDEDPIKIREFLKKYISEDLSRPYEPLIDKINRWLGL